jgi:hypothetical protein
MLAAAMTGSARARILCAREQREKCRGIVMVEFGSATRSSDVAGASQAYRQQDTAENAAILSQ